jgi:UDP-glucose 4-epimerase
MTLTTGKKIFITGGAGFMGSFMAPQLAQKNTVTVYDHFATANVVTKKWLEKQGVHVVVGDTRDSDSITRAMKGHDIVITLAAAHIRLSLTNPRYVHDVNATGTFNTLLAAKKNNVERFAYVSSSEIYGTATGVKMKEDHLKNPTTIYGMSKYMGELYTMQFHRHEGVPAMVIRPFNTYGPRGHFEEVYGEVIQRMVIRALNNLPPIIFGDGLQTRDFTYVTDTVSGIMQCVSCDKALGESVNIAYGKEISIKTIAETVISLTNPKLKILYQDKRPNDVARHAADTLKAQKMFGWKPEVSIQVGIEKYIAWVKDAYPDLKSLLRHIPEKNW